jgi:hypothetical protein
MIYILSLRFPKWKKLFILEAGFSFYISYAITENNCITLTSNRFQGVNDQFVFFWLIFRQRVMVVQRSSVSILSIAPYNE